MKTDASSSKQEEPLLELPGTPAPGVGLHLKGTMRRIVWLALAAMGAAAFALFLCAFLGAPRMLAAMLGWTFFLSPIVALLALIASVIRIPLGKKLLMEGSDVVIRRASGAKRIASSEFVEGWLSPKERLIHLGLRSGNVISAPFVDEQQGHRLLESIGVDASRRTMRVRLGAVDFLNAMTWLLCPIVAFWLADAVGAAVHEHGAVAAPLALVIFILESFLIRRLFGPAHLVIGADGIIVEQRFGSKFVAFEELSSIATDHDHVTMTLVNGDKVRAHARHLDSTERTMIERRVKDALQVRAERSAQPSALAALERGERTGTSWRQAMAALLDKNRGYRNAPLTREQVLSVLSDPGAPSDRRIGAAMALVQSDDAEGRAKIRIAAQSIANQKMRIALEAIADGELESAAIDEAAELEPNKTHAAVDQRQRGGLL